MTATQLGLLDLLDGQEAGVAVTRPPGRGVQARMEWWRAACTHLGHTGIRGAPGEGGTGLAWLPWSIGITEPGHALFDTAPPLADRCLATILDVDLRPPPWWRNARGEAGRPVFGCGEITCMAACLGCDWEGQATWSRDLAVVEALDHAWPGWEAVPPARVGHDKIPAKVVAACEAAIPGWEADGWPLREIRTGVATRSHTDHTGRWRVWSEIRSAP
jgi:hypothetical protein